MYTSFFNLTKKPFSLTPDPEFLYLSSKHKKALSILEYGLMSQAGFTVVTGAIGAGKTTLIQHMLNTIDDNCEVGVITNTHVAFGDLLTWILAAFGYHQKTNDKAERYQLFVEYIQQQYQKGRRVVLIVDEAQNMDLLTLEELRLLSNINAGKDVMLQLILVGQPELVDKLKSPELVQFAQRISVEYHLTPLNYEETEKYIYHRVLVAKGSISLFSKNACAAIYYFTGGVPRLINNISDLALVFAFAEDEDTVTLKTIVEVIKEKRLNSIVPITVQEGVDADSIRHNILENEKVDLNTI